MEEIEEFIGRLEGAKLQLKSLQRTARTTLQVTSELLERANELSETLAAQSQGGHSDGSSRRVNAHVE